MKEKCTTKHLIQVELVEISEKFLYDLREDKHNKNDIFEFLPKYTINKNKGAGNSLIDASYYLQFAGFSDRENLDKKYLLFDIILLDDIINRTVDGDIETFFKDYDFEILLSVFKPDSEKTIKNYSSMNANYFVYEIEHISSHTIDGYDYDFNGNFIGYLNSDMILTKFT
jgi:hypothetical protein